MDDVEDDKKRFEPEAPHEEDAQPDPEEELMLDRGNGRVWLVKVSITVRLNLRMRAKTSFIFFIVHLRRVVLLPCLMFILKDT